MPAPENITAPTDSPPGISLTTDAHQTRIVIRADVSPFWKVIFLASPILALFSFSVVVGLLGIHLRHRTLLDPLLFIEIPALLLLLASAFAALSWLITTVVAPRIVCNPKSFRLEKSPRWLKIPIDDLLSFHAWQDPKQIATDIDFSRNSVNPFRRIPRNGLEIIVPKGRIRILDGIGIDKTRWLADYLNQHFALAPSDTPRDPNTLVAFAASSRVVKPVALFFVLIGVAMPALVWKDIMPGLQSRSWPSVTGHVISSSFRVDRRGRSPTYHADMTYDYSVNSKPHVGNNIAFGFSPADDPGIRKIIDAHPKDSPVTVYYNRQHPEQSVIVPGVGPTTMFLGVLSLFAALLCALCIYPILKRKTPTKEQIALAKRYAIKPPKRISPNFP